MLYRSKEFKGRMMAGRDGELGKVADIFFDDERWVVRYLVVETGSWLSSRQVLISPASLSAEQPEGGTVRTALSREQIKNSPSVDTHQPVSRQYEARHALYYEYAPYWMGTGLWGAAAMPIPPAPQAPPKSPPPDAEGGDAASHLRSCAEVIGYDIEATDGGIGHLDEFLIDPRSWRIERLVIDTRNWLPGKYVQVDPAKIRSVDWRARRVQVAMTREQIESAPEGAG